MLKSMTGYGHSETLTEKYNFKVEIKSLNGKYFELNLRLPKIFLDKEMELRNLLNKQIIRGSVNVFISLEKNQETAAAPLKINQTLVAEYYKEWKAVANMLGADDKGILLNLMNLQDVIQTEEVDEDPIHWETCLKTIEEALSSFEKFRENEGEALNNLLASHCKQIESLWPEVEKFETERLEQTKARLNKNLNDLLSKENYDRNRFEQELVYYLEKLDITEEKNRLKSHCTHFYETLPESNNGRKLNFIAQEIGREINTMGAKANHAELQKTVVKMKEELEKIKEQVLNVL